MAHTWTSEAQKIRLYIHTCRQKNPCNNPDYFSRLAFLRFFSYLVLECRQLQSEEQKLSFLQPSLITMTTPSKSPKFSHQPKYILQLKTLVNNHLSLATKTTLDFLFSQFSNRPFHVIKASKDIAPQSSKILQTFVWWGPHHTNVCKI